MNQKNFKDERKSNAKRRKKNDQRIELQSSEIFKLPIEMLEYIFDYLPAKDLCSVAKTCKWQVAAQCYQKNYSGVITRFYFGKFWGETFLEIPIGSNK